MRRSFWEQVGGYGGANLYANEDWDFRIGARAGGLSAVRVPRLLYFYGRHAESGIATLRRSEWISREEMMKRRAEFFAIGDRAKRFRAAGLLSSAYANRVAGNRRQWAALTAQAVSVDPRLIYPRAKVIVRDLAHKAKQKINNNTHKFPRDWDFLALAVRNQYGYLSHDFPVLGQVIDKTEARSVLEASCGSGRLVPVYLAGNVQRI
jgi:hypothetical protein